MHAINYVNRALMC